MATYQIVSAQNGYAMFAEGGIENDSMIYCKKNPSIYTLTFEIEGAYAKCALRVPNKELFLNYRDLSGAVKLYDEAAYFKLVANGNAYTFYSLDEKQYMWLDGTEPYITSSGDAGNNNALWNLAEE